jgi:hypothetical protein
MPALLPRSEQFAEPVNYAQLAIKSAGSIDPL